MSDGRTARAAGLYVAIEHADLGEDDYHELVYAGRRMATKSGHRTRYGGYYEWHTLVCNNGDCDGLIQIREDRLDEAVLIHLEMTGEAR